MRKVHSFLLIGQSNMAGRGEWNSIQPVSDPRIFMFRNNCWLPAVEPLHDDRPEAGVGLAMSFAAELLKSNPDIAAGLIPCAVGATTISEWLPGQALYRRAVEMARAALDETHTLQAVLWHQGEFDASKIEDVRQYSPRLHEIIDALRKEFNNSRLPFISGELGAFINAEIALPFGEKISHTLKFLENEIPNYACVSAEDLKDKGDHLHFNSRSLREFGQRYSKAYLRLISK